MRNRWTFWDVLPALLFSKNSMGLGMPFVETSKRLTRNIAGSSHCVTEASSIRDKIQRCPSEALTEALVKQIYNLRCNAG